MLCTRGDEKTIFEAYKVNPLDQEVRFNMVYPDSPEWQHRRSDLRHLHLRVGIAPAWGIVNYRKEDGSGYDGFAIAIWRLLSQVLNVTYTYIEAMDNKYGNVINVTEDGEFVFNGMVGMIQRDEIDVIAADVSMTQERNEVVKFLQGIFKYHSR